jgi:hypothetical protein
MNWRPSGTNPMGYSEEMQWLKDNYVKKLHEEKLKDIYLICRNSRLTINKMLNDAGMSYHPWFITPLEALGLEHKDQSPNFSQPFSL